MLLWLLLAHSVQAQTVWVSDLDLSKVTQDWGQPHRNESVDGHPIAIGGRMYRHGVGTHANSALVINLNHHARSFSSDVGVDDETAKRGSVRFEIWVDGRKQADSGLVRGGDGARHLQVSLSGARRLELIVDEADNGIDYDHADWADAQIVGTSGLVATTVRPAADAPMPIYMGHSLAPEINGARTVGCSPGMQFLFKIPASGAGPLRYQARGLPFGLTVDRSTGVIHGKVSRAGTYAVSLSVRGACGVARRRLTIVCSEHKLARTPPMGWNSWNVWGTSVTADKVRAAADAMVREGLINYGYRFVNIDEAWEGKRDAAGNIETNQKFGDMAGLARYVHSKGLLLGIYSSPGPKTCAGYEASYQHEQQDADTYAKWGIDYLKYDWCSYGNLFPHPTLAELQAPYAKMRGCLDRCGRDITFSFCQYGMGDVWKWGERTGGNLWRTTGDITDTWGSMSTIAFSQSGNSPYAGPGHWNDPDMLVVGNLGWGEHPHPTHLTPNEQITHITMWSLLAAPLILGCDLSHLDKWTKALITNHDVIDINQDPLGHAAQRVFSTADGAEVWARPLFDGSMAVGLMNKSRAPLTIRVQWNQLGRSGTQRVYDCWMRRSLGRMRSLSATVPAHGAKLFGVGG